MGIHYKVYIIHCAVYTRIVYTRIVHAAYPVCIYYSRGSYVSHVAHMLVTEFFSRAILVYFPL